MLALFPEISHKAQSGDLESLAVLMRGYFGQAGGRKPKLSAMELVRAFGIPVGEAPIHFFGAIAVKDDSGDIRASILIKEHLPAEQKSFVLCHLLGHFLLHIQPSLARSEWKSSGFKELKCPLRRYAFGEGIDGLDPRTFSDEDVADRFAAAVLMPAAMLRRAVEKMQDLTKVAQIFGVDVQTVERRLDDLARTNGQHAHHMDKANVSTPIDVLNQLAHSEGATRGLSTEQLVHEVDQPVASMSRAVAAHSYQEKSKAPPQSGAEGISGRSSGMDRIREIARKMDKFSERDKS